MEGRDLTGRRLGDYLLGEPLGIGGFATVYRARQLRLDRDVAVKVLDAEVARNPDAARRFEREGRSAAALDHPNIVPVYGAGDDDGLVWLAMRLVDGVSLEQVIDGMGPLTAEQVLWVATPVAAALDHAHANDLVHRDVKPSNILIDDDKVWLTDFGIAATTRDIGRYTTGTLGTAFYMAPEQAEGSDTIDGRADIYSLGCVIYETLVGHPPYQGDDLIATLMAHINQPIPPAGSRELDDFFSVALAKAPDERFQSGRALVAALQTALGPEATAAAVDAGAVAVAVLSTSAARTEPIASTRSVSPPPDAAGPTVELRADRPGRRGVLIGALAAVAVLLVGAAFAVGLGGGADGEGDDPGAEGGGPMPPAVIDGEVTVGVDFGIGSLNPHVDIAAEALISDNVLPTLASISDEFGFAPNVTENTDLIQENPQIVSYTLKDEAVWSDNATGELTPITSADVKATLDFILDERSGAQAKEFYLRIENLDIIDDKTFELTFNAPVAPYEVLFSTVHPILQAADYERYLAEGGAPQDYLLNVVPYSGGPYRVETFTEEPAGLVLTRNDDWWGERPAVRTIDVRLFDDPTAQQDALEDGTLDVSYIRFPSSTQVAAARNVAGVDVQVGVQETSNVLFMNHLLGSGPQADVRVRRAIALGLDRQAIVDSLVEVVTGQSTPPLDSLIYVPENQEYETPFAIYGASDGEAQAKALLDEAGWVVGDDGIRTNEAGEHLTLEYIWAGGDLQARPLDLLQIALTDQFRELGIDLQSVRLEAEDYNTRLSTGAFQLAMVRPFTNADPSSAVLFWSSDRCPTPIPGCTAESGANWSSYRNDDVDQKLGRSDGAFDADQRETLFHEVDALLAADVAALPLYQPPAFTAFRCEVAGVVTSVQRGGPLNSMADWVLLEAPAPDCPAS